jgi:hypothetical protein
MAGALRVCAVGNLVYVLRVRFENSKNLKIEKTKEILKIIKIEIM